MRLDKTLILYRSKLSSVFIKPRQDCDIAFLDFSLADTNIASFSDVLVETENRLTSQVGKINMSYQSTRIPISPQFSTVNQCPSSDSTNGDTEANLFVIC